MSHDTKKTNCNKYSLRTPEFYNRWRKMFLFLVTHIFYMIRFKLVYRLEVQGKENIPKDNSYIIAANHLSTLDPPLVCGVMNRGVAYMAKKELFQKGDKFEWLVKRLGAFAVDRNKPEIATFKTVKDILSTSWSLGVFPQGGIRPYGSDINDLKKGFIVIAKNAKADIVPVAIGEFSGYPKLKPFTRRKVRLHVGKPISYKLSPEEITYEWCKQISEYAEYENSAQNLVENKEQQTV